MNRPHFQLSGGNAFPIRSSAGSALSSTGGSDDSGATSLERLRRLSRQQTGLSDDRIAELRDRIASGASLTRSAAELTASRLVDDNFDLEVLS